MATVAQTTYIAAPKSLGRRGVVAFGASIAFLSFVDRAAISQAAPAIAKDLHLNPIQMGLVFSAFSLTYALGEIPSGWLCDRFGARSVLTRVVILWSVLTAATGLAWNYGSLAVIRLLFGAGESGCFPGLARMFRTWLTPRERNSAEGIKAACARFGAAVTPALMAALFLYFSWRTVFALFGLFGVLWGMLFHRWYRDRPGPVRIAPRRDDFWRRLIASRSAWALGIQWFCHYYGFYFYITWLPLYLYQARGLDIRHGALAAGAPLLAAGLGCLAAGWTVSALTARLRSTARARKLLGYFAYGGAAALLALFTFTSSPALALLAMSLSSFAAEFSSPISWTTAMDIGGERVGTVSGFMNMLGHLGGSIAPAVTGFLLAWTGNGWNIAFWMSAAIYAAGAVCWWFIDPVTPIER
ncbi:MAG TPA: MFS transporter [Bryobacteraceae bacterium]|nr:MFS transporter [Bryobacteraceae bacterium]